MTHHTRNCNKHNKTFTYAAGLLDQERAKVIAIRKLQKVERALLHTQNKKQNKKPRLSGSCLGVCSIGPVEGNLTGACVVGEKNRAHANSKTARDVERK